MMKDIRLDVDRSSSRSAMFHDAVVLSILENFCGKSMSGSLAVRYSEAKQVRADLDFLISTGDDIESFNEDMHIYNGSTGNHFENFFKIASKVLQGNGNLEAHSRRQTSTTGGEESDGVTYIPPCLSVCDLHKKAEKQCLEEGGTSDDVLSLSTLYLIFVPSNEWNAAASR